MEYYKIADAPKTIKSADHEQHYIIPGPPNVERCFVGSGSHTWFNWDIKDYGICLNTNCRGSW